MGFKISCDIEIIFLPSCNLCWFLGQLLRPFEQLKIQHKHAIFSAIAMTLNLRKREADLGRWWRFRTSTSSLGWVIVYLTVCSGNVAGFGSLSCSAKVVF